MEGSDDESGEHVSPGSDDGTDSDDDDGGATGPREIDPSHVIIQWREYLDRIGRSLSSRRQRSTVSFCQQSDITYTDVVIIGNGPSGISLSYMLSGYWPYYNGVPHPNEILQSRLEYAGTTKSLVEMDLESLSDGLEGRSSNPVAVMFDALTHPDADSGSEMKSLLNWQYQKEKAIPHIVLGKKAEGGTWQMMEAQMQTLSLGNWMQLPDLAIRDWLEQYRSLKQESNKDNAVQPMQNRASMEEICAYYTDYVARKGLAQNFNNYSTVTSVERVLDFCHTVDHESGEQNPCSKDHSDKVTWEVRGQQVVTDDMGQEQTIDFCLRAPNVVLATGAFDTPNKLGIPGENLPYVLHSVVELEGVIKAGDLTAASDPVMIVGAGLSAADAVILTADFSIPVVHVFRRDVDDPKIILRQLPAMLYPEYHLVMEKMRDWSDHEAYEALSQHEVTQYLEDGKVVIRGRQTGCDRLLKVSYVVVLIGSRPDLSFLPKEGKDLGIIPGVSIEAKNNPIDVDVVSYQSVHESGLFALGPLVGDNFVRFLRGGALGITSHLWHK